MRSKGESIPLLKKRIDTPTAGAWLRRLIGLTKRAYAAFERERIGVYAAQASYFTVMSLIPMLMLGIMLVGAFFKLDAASVELFVAEFLPSALHGAVLTVLNEVFRGAGFPLVSVTTLLILWTSSKGVRAIIDGLQNIYGADKSRGAFKNVMFSLISTVAFILTGLLSYAVLVFGQPLMEFVRESFGFDSPVAFALIDLRALLFFPLFTLIFALAYRLLAVSGIPFRRHFRGALFASAGWMLFSALYSFYITNFSKASYLYGSLAAFLFFLVWLNMCMTIFLVGAHINKTLYLNNGTGTEKQS